MPSQDLSASKDSIPSPETESEYVPYRNRAERRIREQIREAQYVQRRIMGESAMKAAQNEGFTGRKLRTPRKLIETPEMKRRMQIAFARQGGSMDAVAKAVIDALGATSQASFQGEVHDSDLPDHKTRVHAAKTAADLLGVTAPAAANVDARSINITIPPQFAELMVKRLAGE